MKASDLVLKAGKSANPEYVDIRAAWFNPGHFNQPLLDHIISLGIGAGIMTMTLDIATWWVFLIGLLVIFCRLVRSYSPKSQPQTFQLRQ